MSQVTSPFKFLDSYQQQDADIFFGRERETDALYHALSGVKHLLVHGPSGAGKTSLIECGLRNQFSDADWFALSIRRGQNMTASVFEKINAALRDKIALDPATKLPTDSDLDFGQAIDRLFAERFQPVYLLFDQFEELLLLGSEDEKRDFFTRLHQLIRYKVPCRVLLVMREEFIGHLSEWEHLCPSIFQHRFRLEKMGRSNVRQVLQNILQAPEYQANFRVEQPEQLADSILAKLPDTQREIDLTHVQVFLGELWDRAVAVNLGATLPVLHRDLVKPDDNLERVLDSFLKKQLQELALLHGENVPLELLAAMISERQTKLQVSAADLQQHMAHNHITLQKPLPDLLRDLEEHRILRALKSGEVTQYEITHDLLAKVVGDNLTPNIKMRKEADKIYQVYLGQVGLFTEDVVNRLRSFQLYLAYPAGLEEKIVASERYLQEQKEAEAGRQAAELAAAQQREQEAKRQAETAERLKKEAEKGRKRARTFSYLAGVVAAMAIGVGAFALLKKDEAEQLMIASKYIGMKKLPPNLGKFSIDSLDCRGWNLKSIPANIGEMQTLKILGLSGNNLESLPAEIGKLEQLQELELCYNSLNSLPSSISGLSNLDMLCIKNNKFYIFPKEIEKLKSLKQLYLSSNQIRNLPLFIGELKQLDTLDLANNQLQKIPYAIGGLKQLKKLDISGNQLQNLPSDIEKLKNLAILNLSDNHLTSLPEGLKSMTKLKYLNLDGNLFSDEYVQDLQIKLPNCKIYFSFKESAKSEGDWGWGFSNGLAKRQEKSTKRLEELQLQTKSYRDVKDLISLKSALIDLWEIQFQLGKITDAIISANEAVEMGDGYSAKIYLAISYLSDNQWEKAKPLFLSIKNMPLKLEGEFSDYNESDNEIPNEFRIKTTGELVVKAILFDIIPKDKKPPHFDEAVELLLGRPLTKKELKYFAEDDY